MTAWLVAWLWQGTALAVGLSIALHLLPQVNAATRYLLWWGALVTLVWFGWDVLPEIGPPSARSELARTSPVVPRRSRFAFNRCRTGSCRRSS